MPFNNFVLLIVRLLITSYTRIQYLLYIVDIFINSRDSVTRKWANCDF